MANTDFNPDPFVTSQQPPPPPGPAQQPPPGPPPTQPIPFLTPEARAKAIGGEPTPPPIEKEAPVEAKAPIEAPAAPGPALPPTPSARRWAQRFVPNSPNRDPNSWGNKTWAIDAARQAARHDAPIFGSSVMPSQRESYGVAGGASRQLATFSSPYVGGLASVTSSLATIIGPFLDFFTHNAFSQAYRKQYLGGLEEQQANVKMQEAQMHMRIEEMELRHSELIDNLEQQNVLHQQMLTAYGEVFKRIKSPDNPHGDITEEQARDQIKQLNIDWNHHNMDAMLQNKDLRGVQEQLAWEHGKWLDTLSAQTSLQAVRGASGKTQKEESDLDKSMGAGDETDSGVQKALGVAPIGEAAKTAAAAEKDEPQTPEELNEELKQRYHISDDAVAAARALAAEKKPLDMTPNAFEKAIPKHMRQVDEAKNEIQKRINDAVYSDKTPEDKLADLRKIDRDAASDVGGLTDYSTDPKGKGVSSRNLALAHAVDKNYSEGNYKILNDMKKQYGPEIIRIASLGRAGVTMLKGLSEFSETDKIPTRMIEDMIAGKWSGDPKYNTLNASIQQFLIEESAVTSLTGTPKMAQFKASLASMGETASPAQLRGAMVAHMQTGESTMRSINQAWINNGGKGSVIPMLRDNVDAAAYPYIMGMNTKTGEMAIDDSAPIAIRAVNKVGPPNSQRPLTTEARAEAEDFIRKNQNNLDQDIQSQVRRAIEAVGIGR